MYKKFLLLALMIPAAAYAQRKADRKMEASLRQEEQNLRAVLTQDRDSGSSAETQADQYIGEQFKNAGLRPKGDKGKYTQSFTIDEGKAIGRESFLKLNDTPLKAGTDYFPLSFSASATASGNPLISVQEPGNIWMINIREAADSSSDTLSGLNAFLYGKAQQAADNGATGVVFYTLGTAGEEPVFNPADHEPALKIPVVYIKAPAAMNLLKDATASVQVNMRVNISRNIITGNNVIGYMDNGAGNTIIIAACYDDAGKTLDENAAGTAGLIGLARLLKDGRKRHDNNYLFIGFSGQAKEQPGAAYFLQYPPVDTSSVSGLIHIDQPDAAGNNAALTGETNNSPYWIALAMKANENLPSILPEQDTSGNTGQGVLYRQSRPALFLHGSDLPDMIKFIYALVKEEN